MIIVIVIIIDRVRSEDLLPRMGTSALHPDQSKEELGASSPDSVRARFRRLGDRAGDGEMTCVDILKTVRPTSLQSKLQAASSLYCRVQGIHRGDNVTLAGIKHGNSRLTL